MFTKQVLGLKEAQAALEAIIGEASKDPGMPIAAAVVDDQCEIVCAARMDGATPFYNYMALKKARTAAMIPSVVTGKSTRGWQEFLNTRNFYANDFVPDTTRVPGGVSTVKPGEGIIFGGIGVSGRRGDEDEALAFIGLKALQKAAWGEGSD
jgi:uncharacterized protein GlcG (DUF336 family)